MLRGADVRVQKLVVALTALCLMPIASTPAFAGRKHSFATYVLPYQLLSARASADRELTVLNLLNQERAGKSLPPLVPHAGLQTVARAHGLEMFTRGFLSHLSRDGRTPAQRVWNQDIRVRMVGENLAYAPDLRSAHSAFMRSKGHRRNILSPQFRLVGIAVIDGGTQGVIVVQDFSDLLTVYHRANRSTITPMSAKVMPSNLPTETRSPSDDDSPPWGNTIGAAGSACVAGTETGLDRVGCICDL